MNMDPLTIMRLCFSASTPPPPPLPFPPPLPLPMPQLPTNGPAGSSSQLAGLLSEALLRQVIQERSGSSSGNHGPQPNLGIMPHEMGNTMPQTPELKFEKKVKENSDEEEDRTGKGRMKGAHGTVKKFLPPAPDVEEESAPAVMKPKAKSRPAMRLSHSIPVQGGFLDVFTRYRVNEDVDTGGSGNACAGTEDNATVVIDDMGPGLPPLPPPTTPPPDSKQNQPRKTEGLLACNKLVCYSV